MLLVLVLALATLVAGRPAAAAPQDASPRWLLVRGEAEREAPLSWDRLDQVYVRSFGSRVVRAEQADLHPAANRMVVGRPEDNALVAALAPALGLEWTADALKFSGQRIVSGQGLLVVVDDPDGSGLLALYTGFDEAGVGACFRTSTDLFRRGFAILAEGRVLRRGPVTLAHLDVQPVIVRLDRDFERLMEQTRGWPGPTRNLRVGRGLAGYAHVFAQLGGQTDLLRVVDDVLVPAAVDIEAAQRFFAGRDLDAEVRAAFALCSQHLGPLPGPKPVVYLLFHERDGTNAKNFGDDSFTGRRQILFNLTALARGAHFESALVHEFVHAWQQDFGDTLAERACAEGVATALTGALRPELSDADVLLGSPEDLAAAAAHRDELVTAFLAAADSADRARQGEFLLKGVPLSTVAGAPDRTGYYVAWLACRAWSAQHPDAPPGALLEVPAAELLAALAAR